MVAFGGQAGSLLGIANTDHRQVVASSVSVERDVHELRDELVTDVDSE